MRLDFSGAFIFVKINQSKSLSKMKKAKYPKIKFKINKALDKKMAFYFHEKRVFGGEDFWKRGVASLSKNLDRIKNLEELKREITKEVDSIYFERENLIKKRKKLIEEIYKKKEQDFFIVAGSIFKQNPWPEGKYFAYLSIFDFGPRFLEAKSFQVFASDQEKMILFSIFHEMLHFQFYDYCLKHYPEKFSSLNKNEGSFWEMSEVFNAVVHSVPAFKKLHGKMEKLGYPDHQAKIKLASNFWRGDIDLWIEKYLEKFV